MRRFFGGRGRARFRQGDAVKLNENAAHTDLPVGTVGVVIDVLRGDAPSYEVEFMNISKGTIDLIVVKEAHLSSVDD